ncbi:A24 family peptidase [Pseudomonas asiatica]|uniref:Prepilin peptidase n=1 Tax=Pseudomonas asiatica TaxID=2219225 RepID=A0ABU5KXH8_9PSED|nr:prepilin peptidase [Pseudomonas asiatica]EJT84540.1 protein TadV/CpaA [Pseudomonas putida S11]MDZ5738620.1 prepilin peptidase [Pseudomonas asiatica]MDZ5745389.1 prepilin peptidase [Pseudomonas asiatica]MDZ5749021.1 prepilin peptidase [Pseudomonas asiatica]MDZ5754201.1 prepilin peptidase [Pseudomonas asiatica]
MSTESLFAIVVLLGLLGIAVVGDLRRHRISNALILLGLGLGLAGQAYSAGIIGLGYGALSMLIGFAMFVPMYAVGGMAAGDVKLMAMVGAFLMPIDTVSAALFSLVFGGLYGILIVLMRGQLPQTLQRYWLMLSARAYLAPATDEVAAKPFPYSIAILSGTLVSLFGLPLGL